MSVSLSVELKPQQMEELLEDTFFFFLDLYGHATAIATQDLSHICELHHISWQQ